MKRTHVLSIVAGLLSAIGIIYQIWDGANADKVTDTIAILVQLISGGLALNTGSKYITSSSNNIEE